MFFHMFTRTEVHLNNGDKDYHPGDKIEGTVKCCFLKDLNLQGIWVSLRGKEHTEWTEKGAGGNYKICKGNNVFLEKNMCLLAGRVTARSYEFSFTFELPMTIPGTYAIKNGWIRYCIGVNYIMEVGDDVQDPVVETPFKVVSPIYLSTLWSLPQFMKPITVTQEKNVPTFLCISNESIDIDVVFLKRAFVLGEEVNIEVKVFNRSHKKINRIDLILGQTVTCKEAIHNDTTRFEEAILKLSTPEVISAFSYTGRPYVFSLKIPQQHIDLPNFSLCKLFRHTCWIKVVATLNSSDVIVSTPVILGHVPVRVEETPPPPRGLCPSLSQASCPPMAQPGGPNYFYPRPYLNTTPWLYHAERPHNGYPMPPTSFPNPIPYPRKAPASRWDLVKSTFRAIASTDRFSSSHSPPFPPSGQINPPRGELPISFLQYTPVQYTEVEARREPDRSSVVSSPAPASLYVDIAPSAPKEDDDSYRASQL